MSDKDFEILQRDAAFEGFFRIGRYHVRHRRFDGRMSDVFTREVMERSAAVGVLLYDPRADKVVLVEQFRCAAAVTGDHPWLIEIPAGMVDKGDAPAATARRETAEETGCEVRRMEHVLDYYSSPGGSAEKIHFFVGEVDAGQAGGVHGLASEHEDLKTHVMDADAAIALVESGAGAQNAITVIAMLWLARHRADLRKRWLEA